MLSVGQIWSHKAPLLETARAFVDLGCFQQGNENVTANASSALPKVNIVENKKDRILLKCANCTFRIAVRKRKSGELCGKWVVSTTTVLSHACDGQQRLKQVPVAEAAYTNQFERGTLEKKRAKSNMGIANCGCEAIGKIGEQFAIDIVK